MSRIGTIVLTYGWWVLPIVSFFLFSGRFSVFYNSDDALIALMTYDFQLPRDWYCWGQDRGGNLIPLLAQPLVAAGMKVILATSLVRYGIMIAGVLAWQQFFRTPQQKFLFGLAWFFPVPRFAQHLWLPFGIQVALLGLALWMVKRAGEFTSHWKRAGWLAGSGIMIILSVWVSDFSAILVGAMLVAVLVLYVRQQSFGFLFRPSALITLVASMLVGGAFIVYARSTATPVEMYASSPWNSLQEIGEVIGELIRQAWRQLSFQHEDTAYGLWLWASVLVGIALLRKSKHMGTALKTNPYVVVVLTAWLSGGLALLLSHWVLAYGTLDARYFTPLYLMGIWLLLQAWSERDRVYLGSVGILVLAGSASNLAWRWQEADAPVVERFEELDARAPAGFLGEYWNGFVTSVHNPAGIKAAPVQEHWYRNPDWVQQVLDQPDLYVIRDNWLDTFPDTLEQYGSWLVRHGEPIHEARSTFCAYQKVLRQVDIPAKAMTYPDGDQWISGKELIFLGPKAHTYARAVTTGLSMLGGGSYELSIRMQADSLPSALPQTLVLQVTSDWGARLWHTDTLVLSPSDTLESSSFCLPRFQRDVELFLQVPEALHRPLRLQGMHLEQVEFHCR